MHVAASKEHAGLAAEIEEFVDMAGELFAPKEIAMVLGHLQRKYAAQQKEWESIVV